MCAAASLSLLGFFSHQPLGGGEMSERDETAGDLLEYIWRTSIRAERQENVTLELPPFQLPSWRGVSRRADVSFLQVTGKSSKRRRARRC